MVIVLQRKQNVEDAATQLSDGTHRIFSGVYVFDST